MGVETAIVAGSQIIGAGKNYLDQRAASHRASRMQNKAFGQIESGPSAAEQQIMKALLGAQNPQAPNVGQDALMQLLRADPSNQRSAAFNQMLTTGNPFDTSAQFAALDPIEARMQRNALNTLGAGAGSLGARFGTAFAGRQGDLLAQMTEQAAGRRSTIAQQAYEAAQGRMMGAQNTLLGAAGQYGQNQQAQQAQLAQLLGLLASAQGQRQGLNAQYFGMGMGVPMPQSTTGEDIMSGGMDLATIMMLMRGRGGAGATPGWNPQAPVFNAPTWGR